MLIKYLPTRTWENKTNNRKENKLLQRNTKRKIIGAKSAIDICKIRWELKSQISFSKRIVWCKSINSQGLLQNQFGQLIEFCFLDYRTWWNSAEIRPNLYRDDKILTVNDLNNICFNFGLELQNYSLQLHLPNIVVFCLPRITDKW